MVCRVSICSNFVKFSLENFGSIEKVYCLSRFYVKNVIGAVHRDSVHWTDYYMTTIPISQDGGSQFFEIDLLIKGNDFTFLILMNSVGLLLVDVRV